jgi:hypothetical protein
MVKKKKSATSFRLNDALMKSVAHQCVDLDISQTQAIEDGLRLWLRQSQSGASDLTPPALPAKDLENPTRKSTSQGDNVNQTEILSGANRRWLEMLTGILSSGHQIAISAVQHNLEAFSMLVNASAGEQIGGTTPGIDPETGAFLPVEGVSDLDGNPAKKRRGGKDADRKTG